VEVIILLILVVLAVTIAIGKSGKAVIFFDTLDLLVALAMWLVWLLYFVYWLLAANPSDLVLLITAGISLVLGIKTVQLSVKYNKSFLIGIPIGILKIFCAILGAVLIVGVLDDLIFPSRNQNQGIGCFVIFSFVLWLFGWITKMIVNGPIVYSKKNWTLPSN
jgi:hypothetical protein